MVSFCESSRLKDKIDYTNLVPGSPEHVQYLRSEVGRKQKELELREGLPFLFGWPWYQWAWDFFHSKNKLNFLCAANQVSKSSTQIRKCIDWATNTELWPDLWIRPPKQFWYMYPSQKVADAEWLTKWSLFLPRGAYKEHPKYGWKEIKEKGHIVAIAFNSGVYVFFKTYSQDEEDLQSGTLDALFCDEEMPENLYSELNARLTASDGYFHMVFTATLGQEFWRQVMEPRPDEEERFPLAAKWCVSLYDSQLYIDGAKSHWTPEKIAQVKARCKSHAEFLKRVMGRFVVVGGRKYESFDATRHMKEKHPVPSNWLIFEGVDIGGGGETSHRSAICFVAVRPDFRAGRVFLGWRGDGVITTSGDVFQKHMEMKRENKIKPLRQFYDWGNKDFGTISTRAGEPFEKAEKGHDIGEDVINTLFKNDMLYIYEDPELAKLAGELSTLLKSTPKNKAKDDFADAFRYAVTKINWDFSLLTGAKSDEDDETPEKPMNAKEREISERRKMFGDGSGGDDSGWGVQEEIDEWNGYYES